jgi:hypothetical protein
MTALPAPLITVSPEHRGGVPAPRTGHRAALNEATKPAGVPSQ